MTKPKWGTKHLCTSCGAKFYDFQKQPLICPKCGAENRPEVLLRPKRVPTAAPKPDQPAKVAEDTKAKDDLTIEDNDDGPDDDDDGAVVLDDEEVALTGLKGEEEDEEDEDDVAADEEP